MIKTHFAKAIHILYNLLHAFLRSAFPSRRGTVDGHDIVM